MGSYEEIAIEAVRDWLMELLKKRKWCQAMRVGKALEILVEIGDRPTAKETSCEPRGEGLR